MTTHLRHTLQLVSTTALTLTLSSALLMAPLAAQAQATATPATATAPADQPWMNTSLDPSARADAAVKAMTQAEKLQLVFGYFSTNAPWFTAGTKRFEFPKDGLPDSAGYVPGIARLGIPAQWETDAGVGVATQRSPTPRLRTALPSGISTAATWDPGMAFAGGAMIGHEARLSGFNVQLAGGVDLLREPRNGRNFEYAGEDPLLAGVIDGNEIKGIQSNHIISTLKHYAFNDQETNRFTIDVKIDDKAARESDLLAFQIADEIGKPGAVMCSYNRVNGAYACENDWLLNQVLKTDWGFKGYVMSDWGATHSTVAAANNGLDQESGWAFDRSAYFEGALQEAVNAGYVPQARLDNMAQRILYAMFANGLVDDPVKGDQSATIDYVADNKISQADSEAGIVLLKNTKGLLPIAKTAKKIVIIGSHADFGVLSGGGSSQVYAVGAKRFDGEGPDGFPGPMTYYASSPMKGIEARTQASVTYLDGKDVKAAAKAARGADLVIVFANQWTGESMDVPDLNLPNGQDALISAVAKANKKTAVVLETGGPVVMPWLASVGAVVEAWYPGTSGGEAIARVLTGEVNPSGHLPATFPASVAQLPRPVLDGDVKLDDNSHPHTDYNIEGAAVGYKWFDKKGLTPLFPFGHGLSYTSFSLGGLSAAADGKGLKASFTVKNTGAVEGKEVAQIYVSPVGDAGWEAPKRLGGFTKADLKPGESQTLTASVDPRLLATYDSASKTWTVKAGDYKVMLATSATDIAQTVTVHLDQQTLDVKGQ
ncbi:glycoside hydrolase family 3 C-terminal domain-containing protein [Asticcacaulis sp. EMRT-3]|uniref:glycoside hydrolase family 3 C-terminal domain-containing protein n=1 Tax=Asticcacaulis sp. EMRT-3 TaxID=3040349 RepID=UPI0024AEBC5D|nr:glycoside hydrolase family 3 C-terminal domain-containing protein [Asticcacaulis sp. EMRT-3]MDI7776301.1 glycoside hydrolase family 3 C-terminal domain-containing protein [Asticcacaulis sp. EMRT-3]